MKYGFFVNANCGGNSIGLFLCVKIRDENSTNFLKRNEKNEEVKLKAKIKCKIYIVCQFKQQSNKKQKQNKLNDTQT